MTRPDDEAPKADEEALWRDIVDGYGERPDFPDLEAAAVARVEPDLAHASPDELGEATWEDEGHFVPPTPPPVPRPRGVRAVAWFGLFGVPLLMLVLLIARYTPPSPIGLLMIAWFVGGFGYLVATMKSSEDPDRGWDDGAVL